jgi:glycine oxidase
MVAGGMWNPVSFRTMGLAWNALPFLDSLEETYLSIQAEMGQPIYHQHDLIRVFGNTAEANLWDERSTSGPASAFMQEGIAQDGALHAPFGTGKVTRCGWLDVPALLHWMREQLRDKGQLIEASYDPVKMEHHADGVWYGSVRADYLISCVGWQIHSDSLLSWLPVIPNKGEVLTIAESRIPEEHIVNFGQFILPLGAHRFRLGATFELKAPNAEPTEKAREYLTGKLQKTFPGITPVIEKHQSGFRPTVPDRKPLIGPHPVFPRYISFNGFGSRGVMTIPWLSSNLADFLEGKGVLLPEVDIRRYADRR